MAILDALGTDITAWLTDSAANVALPIQLPLACGIAESNLRPTAERWGGETTQAQDAIHRQDWTALQAIISRAGSDVSFGIGQRVVKFHYHGDNTMTVTNCLAVRDYVFAHEAEDIDQMCKFLGPHFAKAGMADLSPVDGDQLLMALCAYNAGHVPLPSESYWNLRKTTVTRYRDALAEAAALLAKEPKKRHTEGPMKIEDFVIAHPELAIWTEDGSPGVPVEVNERLRIAGSDQHILVEIDGNVWASRIDPALFPPAP